MYEHVICINTLNLTLRSSNHEVHLLDSGLRVPKFACSQGGRRGSDPDPSPVLWPGNIPQEPLYCSLTGKECSENRMMEIHNSILAYTVIRQLEIS